MRIAGASSPPYRFALDMLDRSPPAGLPLHRHLYEQLRALIFDGVLPAGFLLPSTRSLAAELGISRNTVVAAYEQLTSEGYMTTRRGACAEVADLSGARPSAEAEGAAAADPYANLSQRGRLMVTQPRQRSFPGQVAFHPGTPDLTQFPFKVWRQLLQQRMQSAGDDLWGYHYVSGFPALRTAIARHIQTARRVRCEPEQIIVTTGAQASLDLIARLLLDPGDRVWMEEPGYLGAQSAFLAAGARLEPLEVTADGWRIHRPAEEAALPRLIYVTPSCQFPLGATMRMEQRLHILELARTGGAWIIEDDFDSEYRFRGRPIPTMQGIDRGERTIYVGSFSKTLFPALRIGFMVLPVAIPGDVRRAINATGQFPPLVLQATLADFIERGHFARHLARMRRLYARRLELFEVLVREQFADVLELVPCDGGIQTTWRLEGGLRDVDVAEAAARAGVNIAPLSRHYRHGGGPDGVIMGYAALDERQTRAGLKRLRQVFDTLLRPDPETRRTR
jgi:GntR family transcriptional regulator / MocR family aminotransferase